MIVRCQCGSDIPCLEPDLFIFLVSPSHFLNQFFPLFRSSPSHFFESDLPIFSDQCFPHFQVSPSNFSSQTFSFLLNQPFPLFRVSSSYFWGVSASHFFELVLPFFGGQIFSYSSQTFPFFWVISSHFLSQTFPFYLASFYLISSSWFYSSYGWLEDVWLEMSTESIFLNEETRLEEIYIDKLSLSRLSILKRRFKALDLHRRPLILWKSSNAEVNISVQKELNVSGAFLKHRRIWGSLKKQKIAVRKEDVRKTIPELNAEEIQQRKTINLVSWKYRNPGPNYVWHMDGHDIPKPFGFFVYVCIDGFSRKLAWLEVTSSNKVPEIILWYYLKAVKRLKGVPKKGKHISAQPQRW